MPFFVYILRCSDGSYYTGHTDDLERRVAMHQAGVGSSWTAGRLPVVRVFSEAFTTRDEALAAEQQIKGWRRSKKEALIRGDWDSVSRSRSC
jgi:predicted GIY-YIG superfamily endonuclease